MAPTPPALRPYLVLQQALDTAVLAHLRTSAQEVEAHLKRLERRTGIGAAVRRDQLRLAQAAIHRDLARLWTKVGNTTEAANALAAAAGAETAFRAAEGALESVLSPDDRALLLRSAKASASQALRAAQERISGTSFIPLADSVYLNQAHTNGTIDRIVNSGLARGVSAKELADEVRQYVNPNTPGGVKYAAMRLARTELNHAFHAGQVRQAQEDPWVTAVRWHLSGSHPTPDECNQYAEEEHVDGLGAGVFDKFQVPGKPHPNCLCYTTPETVEPDDFVEAYLRGDYDDHLAEQGFPAEGPQATAAKDRANLAAPEAALKAAKALARDTEPTYAFGRSNLDALVGQARARYGSADAVQTQALADAYIEETLGAALRERGMTSVVEGVDTGAGSVYVKAVFYKDGARAGKMVRRFEQDYDGSTFVEHEFFQLYDGYQGTGLATEFLENAEVWYRAHGVVRIDVHANIDVGGYTWAKQGYGWAPRMGHASVEAMVKRVKKVATREGDADALKRLNAMLRQMKSAPREQWPTPYDLAMVGYTEGATEWVGKTAMLNSDWYGVKTL